MQLTIEKKSVLPKIIHFVFKYIFDNQYIVGCLEHQTHDYHVTKQALELYCILFVLMGWSLLPNALRPFQIYWAPPNLGITRT